MRVNLSWSRRDSVKVAQYEVLGNDSKRDVRPARDGRNARPLTSRIRIHKSKQESIVPSGTVAPFFNRQPSTSYWATFIESLRDELKFGSRTASLQRLATLTPTRTPTRLAALDRLSPSQRLLVKFAVRCTRKKNSEQHPSKREPRNVQWRGSGPYLLSVRAPRQDSYACR
jgi:hypothetical protein